MGKQHMKFKEGFVDEIVVPEGKRDVLVFDAALPGFGVRKYANGAAVFIVKYSVGTQQRRKSLGRVSKGNLETARKEAAKILTKAQAGTDVVGEAKAAEAAVKAAAAALAAVVTLGDLVPQYLKHRANDLRKKSLVEVTRYLA